MPKTYLKLTVDNRTWKHIYVRKIGEGQFSCVFRAEDGMVYHLTDAADQTKEIVAEVYRETLQHIPHVERLDDDYGFYFPGRRPRSDYRLYRMPWYAPLTKAYPDAWRLLKQLQATRDAAWDEVYVDNILRVKAAWAGTERFEEQGRLVNERVMAMLRKAADIDPKDTEETRGIPILEALDHLRVWMGNYSQAYVYEFKQKNLRVEVETGRLILLDPMYNIEVVRAQEKRHLKAKYGCSTDQLMAVLDFIA